MPIFSESKSNIILGTASFGQFYGEVSFEECEKMVDICFQHGINFIDTSQWYGHGKSEETLGKILKKYDRKDFIISTKVGRFAPEYSEMFEFEYEKIIKNFDKGLERLNMDYVDLLIAHDVEFCLDEEVLLKQTLPALEHIKKIGKAKNIGISGYSLSFLKDVVSKSTVKIDAVMSYSRYTLFDHSLSQYIQFFKDNNIFLISASPTGLGLLTVSGPAKWHPASDHVKESCKKAALMLQENNLNISDVAIKHVLDNHQINAVAIGPKSVNELNATLKLHNVTFDEKQKLTIDAIIQECFFSKDSNGFQWEGVEIQKYIHSLNNKTLFMD